MNYQQRETNKKQYITGVVVSVIGVIIVYSFNTLLSTAMAATAAMGVIGYLFGKADGYRKAAKEN